MKAPLFVSALALSATSATATYGGGPVRTPAPTPAPQFTYGNSYGGGGGSVTAATDAPASNGYGPDGQGLCASATEINVCAGQRLSGTTIGNPSELGFPSPEAAYKFTLTKATRVTLDLSVKGGGCLVQQGAVRGCTLFSLLSERQRFPRT